MLAIAARFEIANDDWFYDPAVSGADPIEDATRLQRCISLTGDYLWERIAIAVDGFRPLNTARSRLKLVA
jgi:hypothetical protein